MDNNKINELINRINNLSDEQFLEYITLLSQLGLKPLDNE